MAARDKRGPRQPLAQVRPKVAAMRTAAARESTPIARNRTDLAGEKTSPPRFAGKAATDTKAAQRQKTAVARHPVPPGGPELRKHARTVYRRLLRLYPQAHCELNYRDPWELLVATILSAQCTDKRVNMVTPELFARYPTPVEMARAPQAEVERIIKSTGFFRNKARTLIALANALVDRFGGQVPRSMEELVTLPGVGRKTANVVLGNAFGIAEGIVVDTHVARVAARLGLTTQRDPDKIEQELMALFPRSQWTMLSHLLIWHGRRVCLARRPRCRECTLADVCPSATF